MAQYETKRIAGLVIGGAASGGLAYTAEPGKDDPLIAALRGGPREYARVWGEWLTPAIEQRICANDATALIACRQQRLVTRGFADVVGTIAVPTLLYAGSDDPIHDAARQTASQIPTAKFMSLPGLSHIAAMCQRQLILPQVQHFLDEAR